MVTVVPSPARLSTAIVAVMRVDDVADDAEADAGAADLRVDGAPAAKERLEDVRQIRGVDAEAAIDDGDPHDAVRARAS